MTGVYVEGRRRAVMLGDILTPFAAAAGDQVLTRPPATGISARLELRTPAIGAGKSRPSRRCGVGSPS
jgi:hypothetical protein